MSEFRRPSRHRIRAFQPLARLHRFRAGVSALLLAAMALGAPSSLYAGDILRGGASAKNAPRNAEARANAGAEAAQAAKVRAQDRLARTTKAVNDMRALQAAARAAAGAGTIPNGLAEGGLKVLTGANAKWQGANAPTASGNNVNITQTASQALLHWETFNVGSQTTVNFDQSAGGADSGKWIAFNKVFDPTAKPSEIRGKINAQGQVYIINQNGIVFGAGSQINTRALVASTLPINDNLITNGLLNNKDAQFLFSALEVPGGSDGTPTFTPTDVPEVLGDIVVERGAKISSPELTGGNGGRIMLVGANVRNEGEISTPAGQTILAAGLQVGMREHDGSDPSLRGLDVWVGAVDLDGVDPYAGTVQNSGIIESPTGSIVVAGKRIEQSGVLESTTSVNLNGRIDLLANYGAVANPNFDNSGTLGDGAPMFINQFAGEVVMGSKSLTRILPDYASTKSIPGTKLSQNSQINFQGNAISFSAGSTLLAPSGDVGIRAGTWSYKDDESLNRTIFNADGEIEETLQSALRTPFIYTGGTVNFSSGAILDVSGTPDVFVPLSHHVMDVQLRGNELADSPLQRDSDLRGKNLRIDLRKTGVYGGRFWMGTPLGDANGLANIIERNAAQLTIRGGTIAIQAGESVAVASGAELNVSGGYTRNEGGLIQTTRLLRNGNLINIADATPDVVYDGIHTGGSEKVSAKWGNPKTYRHALAPTGAYTEKEYIAGASGGSIDIAAPAVDISGELSGRTVTGPKQLNTPAGHSSLALRFRNQKPVETPTGTVYLDQISAPPALVLGTGAGVSIPGLEMGQTLTIPSSILEEEEGGFGHVTLENKGGTIQVAGEPVKMAAGGSLTLQATNISILSSVLIPGGSLSATAYNYSPFLYAEQTATEELVGQPAPEVVEGTGIIRIGPGVELNVAGTISDERLTSALAHNSRRAIDGGSVKLEGFSIFAGSETAIRASGGVAMNGRGKYTKGKGGSISLLAGKDPLLSTSVGGTLGLPSILEAYSSSTGGSLTLQAMRARLGATTDRGGTTLDLSPGFFQKGGFSNFSIRAIGQPGSDEPALHVLPGTTIEPITESVVVRPHVLNSGLGLVKMLLPEGIRSAAGLSLTALGVDDSFTDEEVEAIGSIVLGAGAKIKTDIGGAVSLKGQTVSVFGSIETPAGSISIEGGSRFPLAAQQAASSTSALTTVYIAPTARLLARGATREMPDSFGRNMGEVLGGGSIRLAGNIVAESGAVLDVSGISNELDIHPSSLNTAQRPSHRHGLVTKPWGQQSVRVGVDSNGGTIRLLGSQLLLSDATLLGKSGGPTAVGGLLVVSSDAFNLQSGADITLSVQQSGNLIGAENTNLGVGSSVLDSEGSEITGGGFFAIDRFKSGGFSALDLGYEYFPSATIPHGGNVKFIGPVNIQADGYVRIAAGGIVQTDDQVSISAPYIAIGQEFRPPLHPSETFSPFNDASGKLSVTPTTGPGSLSLRASHVDVGTLVMMDTGSLHITANNGDIRGSGTLSVAGSITLESAQVYPTTLGKFDIFAYDTDDAIGSVAITQSGLAGVPLSAGGNLRIFATNISQGGTLRAPFGSITLGWDGSDLNTATEDIDGPVNQVAGAETATPVASEINLLAGSTTSVSAIDPATGQGVVIPFGISPDGNTWVDPRGVNVTSTGMPEKTITVSGQGINQEAGSLIDLRGGGDLMAYRWVSGTGGSVDILGSPVAWNSGADYSAGDLVSHNARQYSARMALSPQDFNGSIPTPGRTAYWVEVPESFAVIPGFKAPLAPYALFNSSDYASSLGGDIGYTSGLKIGDRITLDSGYGLPAGTYTLLPRRYALLPGARLVTPTSSKSAGFVNAEGASFASGYRSNFFTKPDQATPMRSSYEILSPDVLANRAEYAVYSANDFIKSAAAAARTSVNQPLPMDSGSLSIHGESTLSLLGQVQTASAGGKGAAIDISSLAGITIGNDPEAASEVFLNAAILNSWKAESLLVGGQRVRTASGTRVDVKADSLLLDGAVLEGSDIILAAKNSLTLGAGSSIQTKNPSSAPRDLTTEGSSAFVRVDANNSSSLSRTGSIEENEASLTIGDDVALSGGSISLDSSRRALISESALIDSRRISIGSGTLLVDLEGTEPDNADILRLGGGFLDLLNQSDSLTLKAYSSLTIAGSGILGSENLTTLSLESGGILGNGGEVAVKAKNLLLSNPNAVAAPAETSRAGQISFQSNHLRLGKGEFTVAGYDLARFESEKGTIITNSGTLRGTGDLDFLTPTIASFRLSDYLIESDGSLNINYSEAAGDVASELGAKLSLFGSSVTIGSEITLPSGELDIRAKNGDVTISSALSVAGSSRTFYDVVKFADAGNIRITSDNGDILLTEGSSLSVKGDDDGGRAGTLEITASAGSFTNQGTLLGQSATGFKGGSFILDVGTTGDFAEINTPLEDGGFNELRSLRVRSGDVLVDQQVTSREFRLSTDAGSIRVSAGIDASGKTGGTISLAASGSLTLAESALLSVEGENFNSAGKGGMVELFAGSQINGAIDPTALLSIRAGSQILLGVDDYVAGGYLDTGSSASLGKFQGRLHLRAPRNDGNTDLLIDPLAGTIEGASAIIFEGYRLFDRTALGGVMNIALRDAIHADAQSFMTNEATIQSRLLAGRSDDLSAQTVVAPGFEIINRTGDLTLGLANPTGSDDIEGKSAADWDLSAMRYGSKNAPGLLTLRASGDIVFNNSLSDGFVSVQPGAEDPAIYTNNLSFEENGHSRLWLAQLQTINSNLPTNFQSWSYTITAGSDLASANAKSILSEDLLEEGKGSVVVGEFYPAVANSNNPDTNPDVPQVDAGAGQYATTANHLRINLTEIDEGTYDEEGNVITEGTGLLKDKGTRYEVVRTGTGDIEVNAGRDVQLRNQFATIYTAGVAVPDATRVLADGDFSTPIVAFDPTSHPEQGSMGRPSQAFTPQWAMAGGNLQIFAGNDIARVTQFTDSEDNISIIPDSSHQFTSNWLYRRGHVDPATGKFGAIEFQDSNGDTIVDSSASTAWWIDYSNFFQGFGTLAGGDIALVAKNDIVNADAVSPTNARMAGIGAEENLAPDLANLIEFGGGDLKIEAGRNIDGGLYYAERGQGILQAGGEVKTNAARSPSLGLLGALGAYSESLLTSTEPEIFLPETWLPTALFVGKGSFEVSAKQDILLGPIANAFLMPAGLGNKFWYKSYFSTFSPDSSVDVKSLGGDVTFRSSTILPLEFGAKPILTAWIQQQNLFNVEGADIYSSNSQPWTRLSESTLEGFGSVMNLIPPTLKVGAFAGSVNTIGSLILSPASRGNLEIVAAESVNGLQPAGKTEFQDEAGNLYSLMGWISSTINLSDANPAAIPGTTAPLSYYGYAGESGVLYESSANFLANIDKALGETGSYAGNDAAIDLKRLRHGDSLLHAGDTEPVRVYTGNGDISGLVLYAPKFSKITSGGSISDVAFYLQNLDANDISIVSAAGDIIPYNEAATLRTEASNILAGNVVLDAPRITANNKAVTALAGDIQISGPGFLEVLAGANLDLGTGENLSDGTGTGIISIGNSRNPNLPFEGASIISLHRWGGGRSGSRPRW
ncbi:MAG: filamentous hemagglutinin N-terminal domain-containing protein [Verrucomicrobia bacterium]|nr:filamentous hemagglutinin N-terminal domain-containing protein [Verrucomicrobiota bacterium]